MATKLMIKTGVCIPVYCGNAVAGTDGSAMSHDPWTAGTPVYLVQCSSASAKLTVEGGDAVDVASNKVVVITDGPTDGAGSVTGVVSPAAMFKNGKIYSEEATTDVRWHRTFDGSTPALMDFALVLHTVSPKGYVTRMEGGHHVIEFELPEGAKMVELQEGSGVVHDIPAGTQITLATATAAGGGATTEGVPDEDDGLPWPPK